MSVTLWINTDKEETIELGGTIVVYQAFTEMAKLVGPGWFSKWPDLFSVLDQCESQDDADLAWLAGVRDQARRFYILYKDQLSPLAQEILELLKEDNSNI